MIALLFAFAVVVSSGVFADSGEDLQKLIWQGKTEWQNSVFIGRNLQSNVTLSRGSPVQHTENVFETASEYNGEIPRLVLRRLEYEFLELAVIKLTTQEPNHVAALQLIFVGIESSNVGEYLSFVVPVSGVLPTENQKPANTKLESSLRNLGHDSSHNNNLYVDSLIWLESVLEEGFVSMEETSKVHPSIQIYDQLFLLNAQYIPDQVLAAFFKPLVF